MPCVFRMDLMTGGVSIRGQGLAEATLRGTSKSPVLSLQQGFQDVRHIRCSHGWAVATHSVRHILTL